MISQQVLDNRQIALQYKNIYIIKQPYTSDDNFYSVIYNNNIIGQISCNQPCYQITGLSQDVHYFQPQDDINKDIIYSQNNLIDKDLFFKNVVDFYFDIGQKKIYNNILNYKHYFFEYKKFKFNKTCSFCPQQYQVYYKNNYVGYIRCRHGDFTFSNSPCGNILFYSCERNQSKNDNQAFEILKICANKYLDYLKQYDFLII